MSKPTTLAAKGSRLTEIEFVRAFAIIGVLAVHATSFATIEMLDHPASYAVYNFFNIFMKFGTPIFIFLSSFVLFIRYFNEPLSRDTLISFYRKRLIYIIIPFVVFSTIYYTVVAIFSKDAEQPAHLLIDFIVKLVTGTAYAHLYFIFISIQFYLLFPIVLLLLKKVPRLIHWCIPIGLAVQWCFFSLDRAYDIPYNESWAFSYFSFYMLGVYGGIQFKAIKETVVAAINSQRLLAYRLVSIAIWSLWIFTGLWHVFIRYQLKVHEIVYPHFLYSFLWNLYVFATIFVFMQTAFYLHRKISGSFLLRKLRELGQLTFGIYLIHPLLLAAYRELRPTTEDAAILHSWYAGGFLLALVGSWLIVALTHRFVPFAWMLFGKNELKKRDKPRISA